MEKVNEGDELDFKWGKKRRFVKNKEITFYESFIYDGVEYMLYDCVYMYKEGLSQPYIGKLTKIWERRDKSKKVKVHWFFLPEEISKWLRETKTLENEIFLASGEGRGLANVNPLEAIAGLCNVVCTSKNSRNHQPSDEELKAADFIFYRTFNVQSCTILDKMDDKVGDLEINHVFNIKKGEKDTKEENSNTVISCGTQKIITKITPNILKEDPKGDPQDNDTLNLKRNLESDMANDRPSKKLKSDDKCVESGLVRGSEKMTDLPSVKPKVDKDVMKVSTVRVEKVENTKRDKTPTGSDKLHDQSLEKLKSDDKKPPKEKPVQHKVARDSEKLTVDRKLKQGDRLPTDVNNLKTSGTSGPNENQNNGKMSGKVTEDLERKKLDKTKDDGSSKVPDSKKICDNTNEKDSVANSALSKEKVKSGTLDSNGNANNMEVKNGESAEKMNKYDVFLVTRRPNPPNTETSKWFIQSPFEEKLKDAYDHGKAILLHNLKADYTSEEVEDIIFHAFKEYCDAKILPHTAVSSPHYVQALILLKTKEAAQRILAELDDECLMILNGRPLVGTPCPPISTKNNCTFFGHLSIDKDRSQSQRGEDEAVSTPHFSQPNTIEYDMAMEWCLQQLRSEKCWTTLHQQQRRELTKLEKDLKQKRA